MNQEMGKESGGKVHSHLCEKEGEGGFRKEGDPRSN